MDPGTRASQRAGIGTARRQVRRCFRSHRLLLGEIRRRQTVRRWDDESFFAMARRCDHLDEIGDRPMRFMAMLIGTADLQADDWWAVAEMVRQVLDDSHGSETRTPTASCAMKPVMIDGSIDAVDATHRWSATHPVACPLCLTA